MKSVYCTLFNLSYLVKGLALYSSMKRCIPKFHLYILAMDDETEKALNELALESVTVVNTESVFDEHLNKVLDNRSGPSLFWTCTPLIIEYVLTSLNEEWCTYIDADCFFFGDPCETFTVMNDGGYSVGIVEHRFRRDSTYNDHIESDGRFNVAFNVFRKEENSLMILRDWKKQCIEQCTNKPEGGNFGDQLYLNEWPDKYQGVYVIENEGIDVAPWNVNNFKVICANGSYRIVNDCVDEKITMYHFHALNYVFGHLVSLNLWNTKKRGEIRDLLRLYREYIDECNKQQDIASKYYCNTNKGSSDKLSVKIMGLYLKYRNRKENSLIQIFRNIMWV